MILEREEEEKRITINYTDGVGRVTISQAPFVKLSMLITGNTTIGEIVEFAKR